MINLATGGNIDPMSDPETRQAIEAARATVKAERHGALLEELGRYQGELLPGSVAEIARLHGGRLGVSSDPARLATAVSGFVHGPLAARFRKPEADALKAVIVRYSDRFKNPAAAVAFYQRHAMDLAHRPESEVTGHVVRLLHDRASNEFLADPIPPSPQVKRVAALMAPWQHQLSTDAEELAESWTDLVDPMRPAMPDLDVQRTILTRLALPHNREHLRVAKFDPADIRGQRAGVGRPAVPAEEAPARKPLFTL